MGLGGFGAWSRQGEIEGNGRLFFAKHEGFSRNENPAASPHAPPFCESLTPPMTVPLSYLNPQASLLPNKGP